MTLIGFNKENYTKDVLDPYKVLYEDEDIDVTLMWGGRDSGKTFAATQKMVFDCITQSYFRCILVKKTYESIKDSQFQAIKDFVYDYNLESLFQFKTSPLEIICTINGNKFIARGCDKPEKLKSIKDPSDVWYEEGNQLTEQDYIVISTTLRTDKARVKELFSFNPEASGDFQEFWLYKRFFAKYKGQFNFVGSITQEIEVDGHAQVVELKYRSIHTTYKDNPFVTPERIARHETLKQTNPHYYRVFTLGLWGNEENDSPYFAPFDRSKLVRDGIEIWEDLPLWFSFDFNLDPCTVVIGQYKRFEGLTVLDCIQNSDGTRALCEEIMGIDVYANHPGLIKVTGDNSGYSGSSIGGRNSAGESINDMVILLEVFSSYRPSFKKKDFVRPNKVNRAHELSRTLCNEIFHSGIVEFDGEYTMPLVKDIEKAIPDPKTGKLYKNRDKGFEMDLVDALRYLFNAWFPNQLKDFHQYVKEIQANKK